jgi:hypothetical protein
VRQIRTADSSKEHVLHTAADHLDPLVRACESTTVHAAIRLVCFRSLLLLLPTSAEYPLLPQLPKCTAIRSRFGAIALTCALGGSWAIAATGIIAVGSNRARSSTVTATTAIIPTSTTSAINSICSLTVTNFVPRRDYEHRPRP